MAIHFGHAPGPDGFDLPGAAQAEQAQVWRVCAPEEALSMGCIQRQRRQRRRGVGADGNHWALVRHRPLVRGLEHLE
ncbi:hypothetical protein AYK59_15505 [Pseudomonas synxantha]|nr:hypothetical protein AYK59_15505 [Pseudomonas synxantha]